MNYGVDVGGCPSKKLPCIQSHAREDYPPMLSSYATHKHIIKKKTVYMWKPPSITKEPSTAAAGLKGSQRYISDLFCAIFLTDNNTHSHRGLRAGPYPLVEF